jgi:hypothetical protein
MAADDFDPMSFTPWNLGPQDPLIDWASNLKPSELQDFVKQHTLDPQSAIDKLIERGIAPPPTIPGSASSYVPGAPPATPTMGWGGKPVVPQDSPMARPPAPEDIVGDPRYGNLTDVPWKPGDAVADTSIPKSVMPAGVRQNWPAPLPVSRPAGADLDAVKKPVEVAAAEGPRAAEEKPEDTSSQNKKKGDFGEAMSDFQKSLAGVKALAPPPVNPVGTPSVRSPTSINAPGIQQLLALAGQRPTNQIASLASFFNRGRIA